MSQKSLFGWGILAVALAVPAVLVWNVRMKIKSVQPVEYKVKASPPPGASPVSETQAGTQAPAGAQSASTGAAAGAPPAAQDPAAQTAQPPQPSAQAALPSPPAGEEGPSPAPFVPSEASASAATLVSASRGPADPDAIEYSPNTMRDPMVSPFDLKRLAREREEKEMIRGEVEAAARPAKPKKVQETPIEQRIEVYGVVATPNGIEALINDRRVREGDSVLGAKVKKITTGRIRFEYRGRVFEKKVSQ
ncbi:MAG: hypothetical protein AAB576_07130 [Elusimicrobiota bacterium]